MRKKLIGGSTQQFADMSTLLEDEEPEPTAQEKAAEPGGQQETPEGDKTNEAVKSCVAYIGRKYSYFDDPLGQ